MNARKAKLGLGFLLLMSFDTVAQVSFKLAGMHASPPQADPRWLLGLFGHPWIYGAIAGYLGAFFTWIKLLRWAPIGPAFAASHMEVISVILISAMAFGEHLGVMQMLGALLIIGGIAVLAVGAAPETPAGNILPTLAKGMRKIPRLGCCSEPELSRRRRAENQHE